MMAAMTPNSRDDGPVSEITILPDGRVYLFGLTRPLLDVLAALPVRENHWREMNGRIKRDTLGGEPDPPPEPNP